MVESTKINVLRNWKAYRNAIFISLLFLLSTGFFYLHPTLSEDWTRAFYPIGAVPLHPYTISHFINPPWVALIFTPFQLLPMSWGAAINMSISVFVISWLIIKRGGSPLSIFLTLFSYPFISQLSSNNIDWIPALGYLIPNGVGVLLLLAKPQSGSLVALDWFRRSKHKVEFCAVPIAGLVISFLVWKNWIHDLMANVNRLHEYVLGSAGWNFSLLPWSIPLGIILLIAAFFLKDQRDSELSACVATYCLVPYFSVHSLVIPFALLSASQHRWAVVVWFGLWALFLIRALQ